MAAAPKISLVMTTYNRAHLISRAISSVLAQDCPNWELIIVDDGSTDNTSDVLARYRDPRIRCLRLPKNVGVNAAKNAGFGIIRGEWFTFLDSDDELLGTDALSTLLSVPERIDPTVDAVSCNVIDSTTGTLAGKGLDGDGYLDWKVNMQRCRGEFWGITKTGLLNGDRFHEEMRGFEDFLWYKIDKRARRYYIHRALRIYHTEGNDRVCREKPEDGTQKQSIYRTSCAILEQREILVDLRTYGPDKFLNMLYRMGLSFVENNDRRRAARVLKEMFRYPAAVRRTAVIAAGMTFGPRLLRSLRHMRRSVAMFVGAALCSLASADDPVVLPSLSFRIRSENEQTIGLLEGL